MEELKTQQDYFNEFTRKIIDSEDYRTAYEILCKNMKARKNHDYDDHLFLQFSLLKEILKDENLDFSFLEDGSILITSEEYESGSMYETFVKFKYAVLAGNFQEASKQIMDYELREKRKRTNTRISTKIFVRLASAAARKSYEEKKEPVPSKPVISKEQNALKYNENYYNFLMFLEQKEYEKALESVLEASKYVDGYSFYKVHTIIKLLKSLIKVQSGEMISIIGEPMYDDLKNEYKKILYRAISKNDYKTAYQNIGKCIYFDPRNKTLKIYHTLLCEIAGEIKKQQNRKAVTKEELLTLLENREYQRAIRILENGLVNETNEQDRRMNHQVLELLKVIERCKVGKEKFKESTSFVKNKHNTVFENFFDSLAMKDYITAYEYVVLCYTEKENQNIDCLEFLAYSYLLEDISLYQKIKKYTHDEEFTNNTLEELKTLYEQKLQVEEVNSKYDQYVLEVIGTYQAIEESVGTMVSFQKMHTTETDIIKQFEDFMNQGDYLSAYHLIKDPTWKEKTKYFAYKNQIILIKKVIAMIIQKIKIQPVSEKIDLSMMEMQEGVNQLETLANFIEKEDYIEAETYNFENSIDGSPDLLYSLSEFLPFLSMQQLREAQRMFYEYSMCYKNKDLEGAKSAMEAYRNYIKNTSLERNTSYYSKRIESLAKELNSPNFELKQNLIEKANESIENKQQSEAIDILTEYINLDNDMSSIGYSLRGNTYECLKLFHLAKEDYQKALSIVDEPNVFFRLAKVSFYQENYEQALEYMLEFESRRPWDVQESLCFIQEIYRKLGNEAKVQEYIKKSARLVKAMKKKNVFDTIQDDRG